MKKALVAIAGLIVVIGVSAGLYRYAHTPAEALILLAPATPSPSQDTAGLPLLEQPQALPELRFVNGDDAATTLTNFRGKVVLLNIWATWCVPCREEMPTLDRLQAELGGTEFVVVALSIDQSGVPGVRAFFSEIGIRHLDVYVDASGKVSRDLNIIGLPTTLLIDRKGRELGRKIGPLKWDDPNVVSVIRRAVVSPSPEQGNSNPATDRRLASTDDATRSGAIHAKVNQISTDDGLTFQ